MKVCLYNVTTTTQFGGVETFVWEIAARLPADVQVDVVGGRGPLSVPLAANARVFRFAYLKRETLGRIPLLRRSKTLVKLLERLSFGACALPHLLKSRYDIIHIQKPYDLSIGVLVRALTGSKLLFGCHGTDYLAGDRLWMRWIDGAVSCSNFNAGQILEHYRIAPVVVYNGFDAARFFPRPRDEVLRARFARPEETLLLYAGRLIGWKGVSFLLQALARLDQSVKLIVAGEGPARADLEQEARAVEISDRVAFLGRVEQADLPNYYLISDLVVLPSLTHETFSIVACEAQACKRPVVGSNIGGIPELVEELVRPGDAGALAEKLQTLAADPARRERIAERGHARVWSFLTWEATTARVYDVYRRMLQGERVLASHLQPIHEATPTHRPNGESA